MTTVPRWSWTVWAQSIRRLGRRGGDIRLGNPELLEHLARMSEEHVDGIVGCVLLAAGHGSEDDEWFCTGDDRVGQWRIGRLVGEILFARKEPDECSALLGVLVAECSAQNRVLSFERIKDETLGGWAVDVECHFAVHVRECS